MACAHGSLALTDFETQDTISLTDYQSCFSLSVVCNMCCMCESTLNVFSKCLSVCVSLRVRDICGCPLEERGRPAQFSLRFLGLWCCSCCLLLYQLPEPVMQPGRDKADYLYCDCDSSKRIIWNLWCSLSCISSVLPQKDMKMSELAEASWSCLRMCLSAVVWVSLTERPICCSSCLCT